MPNFDYKDFMVKFLYAERNGGIDTVKRLYETERIKYSDNVEYYASFVMTLNHLLWDHFERGDEKYARLYDRLYKQADRYACDHFKGEDAEYYFSFLD